MKVETLETTVSISKVTKISGDVTVTQRKGKLRHNFDLNITISWNSTGENEEEGIVEIRDFMSDTDKKGFEFYIKTAEGGKSISAAIKSFIEATLKDCVWDTLQEFAADLVDEHGKHLLVPSGNHAVEHNEKSEKAENKLDDATHKDAPVSAKKCTKLMEWKEAVTFQAPPSEVFSCLTQAERIRLWTRGPIEGCLDKVGSSFSLFSGAVSGTVESIDPSSFNLGLKWRLGGWSADVYSTVTISIEKEGNGCSLDLKQSGIPMEEYEATSSNWANYYWNPIKATFGYGAFPKY